LDNSRILQRNGRISGIPACGAIPRYNHHRSACPAEQRGCGCTANHNCTETRGRDCGRETDCTCNEKCTYLAISSVKMQKWCDIYELEKGYCRGTIFSQLDLPFCGKGGRCL